MLKSDGVIRQDFKAKAAFNEVDIEVPTGSQAIVQVVDLQSHHVYRMHREQDYLVLRHFLPAGSYRMQISNPTKDRQPVFIIEARNYRMAPSPLVENGKADYYRSLIYSLWNNNN